MSSSSDSDLQNLTFQESQTSKHSRWLNICSDGYKFLTDHFVGHQSKKFILAWGNSLFGVIMPSIPHLVCCMRAFVYLQMSLKILDPLEQKLELVLLIIWKLVTSKNLSTWDLWAENSYRTMGEVEKLRESNFARLLISSCSILRDELKQLSSMIDPALSAKDLDHNRGYVTAKLIEISKWVSISVVS